MIEPTQSLKKTQTYGRKLKRAATRLARLGQDIHDLGSEVEASLPETQQGGLVYQQIMEIDKAIDALSKRMYNLTSHISDLSLDDCDPLRVDDE